ncbi:G-protein coupled receptor 62 [Microcaecilia unicolor]|uniref:Probable G-protein coupled receptor n=1 Tax=Microcaecilia unicolor TaxID=1415580 RepID=A0A6P7YJA6_9AMPH|nr:probable G-protein coupled receptor [Microcaecilia unicolor]
MANRTEFNVSQTFKTSSFFVGASKLQDIVGIFFMVLLNVIALLANTTLVVVILKNPVLRKFVFVCHLCLVDLFSAILLMPLGIVSSFSFLNMIIFSFIECQTFIFLNVCVISASILTISVISIERYYYIVHPMRYEIRMTVTLVATVLVFIWIKAVLVASLSLMGWPQHHIDINSNRCSIYWSPGAYKKIFVICFSILCFVLPTLIIFIVYCSIYKVARTASLHHGPVPSWTASSRGRSDSLNSQMTIITTRNLPARLSPEWIFGGGKAALMLILIVGQFLFCWLPFFSFQLYFSIHSPSPAVSQVETVVTWLAYSSFAINPFFHGFLNRQIREEFSKLGRHFLNRPINQDFTCSSNEGSTPENFFQFLQRTSSILESRSSYISSSPKSMLEENMVGFRIPGQIPEDTS